MRRSLVPGLAAAVIAAAAMSFLLWMRGTKSPPTAEEIEERLFLRSNVSGHAGKASVGPRGKEWVGYLPFYREGPLQVYAGQAGPHGTQRGPVFLLLMRLAPKAPWRIGELSTAGEAMEMKLTQDDAAGREFTFLWRAEGVPDIVTTTPVTPRFKESIAAGGRPYAPEKGRVFLVDLTSSPPAVVHVDGDLPELFKGAGEEITGKELKEIVERLATLERPVEAFLEALPRP